MFDGTLDLNPQNSLCYCYLRTPLKHFTTWTYTLTLDFLNIVLELAKLLILQDIRRPNQTNRFTIMTLSDPVRLGSTSMNCIV